MKKISVTTAAFSALLAHATHAQEDPFDLGTLVISASRTGATENSIPGTVEVIEADALQDRLVNAGGGNLEQVLADLVPGFAPSNGALSGASQTLRGRRPQILIDGVARTSELRGSSRELNMINPESIERIEIVKGSTARFGNGATGGIINIVTKRPADGTSTTIKTGISFQDDDDSFGADLAVSHDRRVGDLGLRFELSGRKMNDRYDGSGNLMPSDPIVGQGSRDNFDQYSLGIAADYQAGSNRFEARVDTYRFEQDIDLFANYSTDPVSNSVFPYTGDDVLDKGKSFSLTWNNDSFAIGDVELNLFASDITRRSAYVPAGIANPLYYTTGLGSLVQDPFSQGELSTKRIGAQLTIRSDIDRLIPGGTVTWGMDLGRDKVEQKTVSGRHLIAPMEQDNFAAFAQLDMPIGNSVELSAGLRAERFELEIDDFVRPDAAQLTPGGAVPLPATNVIGGDFDYDEVVGNIGAVWHVNPKLDLFAGFSQGYSVPDVGGFTRRAMAANPFLPGQTVSFASIRPQAQKVDTYEIGLRYSGESLRLSTSAFFATSDDGVIFDSTTSTITQQKEETWGAELDLAYVQQENWNVGLLAAYVEGKFDSNGNDSVDKWLPNNRIPSNFTATLYGNHTFDNGLSLGGELVYASGRDRGDNPVLDDNIRVNVFGSYPLGRGQLRVGISNLFDRSQDNPTASSVRSNPLTGDAIRIADEGRRFSMMYEVAF